MGEEYAVSIPKAVVREQLLSAAAELFARKGYAATTVREIVAAAGVSKPVLYYYFHNKEGIYLELMQDALAKFEALIDFSQSRPEGASGKILTLCDRLIVLLRENMPVARVMYSIYYGPPQGAPFFDCDVFHFRLQATLGRLLEEGIARGEFRKGDPMDMSWAVLGAVNIAIEVELCHPEMSLGREGLARVLAMIFNGLRNGREQ